MVLQKIGIGFLSGIAGIFYFKYKKKVNLNFIFLFLNIFLLVLLITAPFFILKIASLSETQVTDYTHIVLIFFTVFNLLLIVFNFIFYLKKKDYFLFVLVFGLMIVLFFYISIFLSPLSLQIYLQIDYRKSLFIRLIKNPPLLFLKIILLFSLLKFILNNFSHKFHHEQGDATNQNQGHKDK